jgi:hypothetical protein
MQLAARHLLEESNCLHSKENYVASSFQSMSWRGFIWLIIFLQIFFMVGSLMPFVLTILNFVKIHPKVKHFLVRYRQLTQY